MRIGDRAWTWLQTSPSRLAHWLRAIHEALLGDMPVLASGTSLYALLAAVPTLAAVVGIYGLVADPHEIHGHLRGLASVLPPEVLQFLSDQLERQAQRSTGELGVAVATSLGIALYSARGAARGLIIALNCAYRIRDVRSWPDRLLLSFAMAAATLVALVTMFGVIVALPGIAALFHLRGLGIAGVARWPILMALFFTTLLLLYRYAPSPRPLGATRYLWPGSLIATVLLVLVSWGLSQWVERVSNYALIYGAFGSVVVVILWFYLSTIALILGGFLNAELERLRGAPPARAS